MEQTIAVAGDTLYRWLKGLNGDYEWLVIYVSSDHYLYLQSNSVSVPPDNWDRSIWNGGRRGAGWGITIPQQYEGLCELQSELGKLRCRTLRYDKFPNLEFSFVKPQEQIEVPRNHKFSSQEYVEPVAHIADVPYVCLIRIALSTHAKSYDHVESPSNLQDKDLHRTQHKFDDFGRKNKERP